MYIVYIDLDTRDIVPSPFSIVNKYMHNCITSIPLKSSYTWLHENLSKLYRTFRSH